MHRGHSSVPLSCRKITRCSYADTRCTVAFSGMDYNLFKMPIPFQEGYNVIRDRTVVMRRTAVKATSVQVDCISRRRRKRATACRGWLRRTKLQR